MDMERGSLPMSEIPALNDIKSCRFLVFPFPLGSSRGVHFREAPNCLARRPMAMPGTVITGDLREIHRETMGTLTDHIRFSTI